MNSMRIKVVFMRFLSCWHRFCAFVAHVRVLTLQELSLHRNFISPRGKVLHICTLKQLVNSNSLAGCQLLSVNTRRQQNSQKHRKQNKNLWIIPIFCDTRQKASSSDHDLIFCRTPSWVLPRRQWIKNSAEWVLYVKDLSKNLFLAFG